MEYPDTLTFPLVTEAECGGLQSCPKQVYQQVITYLAIKPYPMHTYFDIKALDLLWSNT